MKADTKIVFACLAVIFFISCTKTKNVVEACNEYKEALECESALYERLPTSIDCEALKPKFERICTQKEINFAFAAFKKHKEQVCAAKNISQIKKMDMTHFEKNVSQRCLNANITPPNPLETINEL